MKVLHIGKYFPPHRGGMETFLRDLAVEQTRQGLDVLALVHRSERSFRSIHEHYASRDADVAITRVGRCATVAFAPISPLFIWHLWRLIRLKKPDVLHLHLPNTSAFWCLFLPSARRLPWIVHWHSDVVPSPLKPSLRWLYRFYRWPERLVLERATAVIASSPNYLQSSTTLQPYLDKCHVVPLAIEDPAPMRTDLVDTDREDASAREGEADLAVLAVGRLTYYKGFDVLIRALNECPDVRVTLVGDGEERANLETLAEGLGVSNRVSFRGNCNDDTLEALYRSSDLLCLPSIERTEAFGIVLLEAMSRGLPCVVSDVPGSGMGWVIGEASDTLVPPGNVKILANLLNRLARERATINTLSAQARARFDEMFSLASCTRAITKLYRNATQG